MEHFISVLVIVASLSFLIPTSESLMFHITSISSPNFSCPQPCHLLDYYAMNPSLLSNKENVSLIFYDGSHTLNHTLEISGTKHVQLTAVHHSSIVTVQCIEDIWLSSIAYLELVNLKIHGNVKLRNGRIWPKSSMIHTGYSAQLQYLTIDGIALTFAASNSSLHFCKITKSFINICSERSPNTASNLTLYETNTTDTRIGRPSTRCKDLKLAIIGCIIARSDHYDRKTMSNEQTAIAFDINSGTKLNVRVIQTTLIEGYIELIGNDDNSYISLFINGSEIKNTKSCLIFKLGYEARNNHIQIQIVDSNISDSKQYGLTVEADMTFGNMIEILLSNTVMKNHTNLGAIKLSSNHLYSTHDSEFEWSSDSKTVMNITINGCKFIQNKLAIGLELESNITLRLDMLITGSILKDNENAIDFRRKSFHILTSQTTSTRHLSISLRNVTLKNNHPMLFQSGVIRIVYVDMLNIHNCKIVNNKATAIESYFSAITLSGENLFSNNTSIRGGALVLYESYLYFILYSRTFFFNNSASEVGGAIYVNQLPYFKKDRSDEPPCFYQVHSNKDSTNLYIGFKGNLAASGGNDIYGGALHGFCRSLKISETIKFSKFYFDSKSLSSVTSDPKRVCVCDNLGVPQCAEKEYIYLNLSSYYPGEIFIIPAVVVGNDFGTVPGIVHSKLTWVSRENSVNNDNIMYLQLQEIKDTEQCSLLTFSIQSQITNTDHELQLFVKEETEQDELLPSNIVIYSKFKLIKNGLLSQRIHINFTLLDCPIGFNLTSTPPYVCNCHPKLLENNVRVCVIKKHTGWIYRSGTIWVSDSFTDNISNSFIIHQHCPYHYCKSENTSVDLKYPDTQCAFNHSGVLCGGCYGNLSLALGSSRCLPCSNDYLSLLVAFIFAGIALVVFIKTLDLTVARGTINGLIFYANVVWANKTILFPTIDALHPVQHFFYTFIAWLNLDLGIETCFVDGLDAYWKTWLQFVFPLYVWSITCIIIIVAHYSTRASKIFGNNSVPVLATLILLSYTKLLRTIIISLGFSLLNYDDGTRIVWSFDGNVPYFDAAHTILFLVALAALFFLWLPYTIILFILQWLRQKSHITPLQWINRWKPFFDAYSGQIKPKHHYWIGLLLLLRVFLLVLYAATSTVVPRINILAIVSVGLLLFVYMQVVQTGFIYTSVPLSLLEGSFIMNLTILGIVKLYLLRNDPAHTSLIYTSVGITFIKFLIIVIYHTWSRIQSTYLTLKRRHKNAEIRCPNGELRVMATVPQTSNKEHSEPLLVQQTSVCID